MQRQWEDWQRCWGATIPWWKGWRTASTLSVFSLVVVIVIFPVNIRWATWRAMKSCKTVFFRCPQPVLPILWQCCKSLQSLNFQSVCYYSASKGPGFQGRYWKNCLDNLVQVLPPRMFSSLQEEMTSRVREGRRRKKAQKQSDDEDELNTSDCEVFQCGAASVGHLAYRSHLDLKEKTVSTF